MFVIICTISSYSGKALWFVTAPVDFRWKAFIYLFIHLASSTDISVVEAGSCCFLISCTYYNGCKKVKQDIF